MHRGKKIVALVSEACNLQDRPENVAPKSDYDPNKVIHVLEDIQLQYSESRKFIPGPSDKTYYEINDDINITSLTDLDLPSTFIPEKIDHTICSDITFPNTTFSDVPLDGNILSTVYDVNNTFITDDNLIIVPSHIEIDSQATNILISDNVNSSDTHTIQTLGYEQVFAHELSTSPVEIIPHVENTHHVIPNPPISDDSDIDKKLVPYSDSDSDSLAKIKKSKKRKKRFKVDKKEWVSEKNKQRRQEGKTYFGREKKQDCWNYNKSKEARSIKPRCSCKIGKYSTLKCETVDEDVRRSIFNRFWSLTWGEKKTLVNEWVTTIPIVRPRNRNTEGTTKRANTFVYHLKINDQSFKVCRKMFLNTLDLGRWTVQNWKHEFSMRPPSTLRRPTRLSETASEPKQSLIQFLDSLPVMESHYCRATSQKLYLLPEWNSKESLYKFYVDNWCKDRNIKALSISLFSNLFEDKNLALFKPKKDQCEKCACYKVGTITEEEYKEHIERSKQAREEKDADKKGDNYVFTVDLQAVLMAPKSNVSTLYYKTKLQVHNLCFFNIKNKDGFCFIWNEVEGGLNAEEFASIWVDFLENKIIPEVNAEDEKKTIIIYSDGCTYQNRNCILSNALLNIVMRHKNIAIEQKFLEVGHTQMEADSMHSTIERHLKNKVINVPAEYISIAKHARKCPVPYSVTYLDHTYFKKFDKIQFYKSIRPGRSKGDLKVTDIRALRYESNGSILIKLALRMNGKVYHKGDLCNVILARLLNYLDCTRTDVKLLHENLKTCSK